MCFLRDIAHPSAPGMEGELAEIETPHVEADRSENRGDGPRRRLVPPGDQLRDRRLHGAKRTDEGGRAPATYARTAQSPLTIAGGADMHVTQVQHGDPARHSGL